MRPARKLHDGEAGLFTPAASTRSSDTAEWPAISDFIAKLDVRWLTLSLHANRITPHQKSADEAKVLDGRIGGHESLDAGHLPTPIGDEGLHQRKPRELKSSQPSVNRLNSER